MSASPPPASPRSLSVAPDLILEDGLAKLACEECRRRKLKCSRALPSCNFCTEHKRECTYVKVIRTPLTRKNLDAAEKRIAELEKQLERRREKAQFSNPGPFAQPTPPGALGSSTAVNLPLISPNANSVGSSNSPVQPFAPIASGSGSRNALGQSYSPNPFFPSGAQQSPPIPGHGYPSMPPPPPPPARAERDVAAANGDTSAETPVAAPPPHPDADGTGSLTVDEGSAGGYLGSLSGATLLHFLQRCAADVNLTTKGVGGSVTSPASTIASNAPLPPDQAARYIDAYFRIFHVQYPLVHEASFRAQLAEIIPRTGGAAWNLLHQVILGIGSMCISPSQDLSAGESSGDTSLRLYDRAASIVNAALFENSNNTSVQAFILLGNYAQKLNHPSAGSVFLGIALRMAINLGLHCESSARNMTPFEQETRRRIWWTLFCFDCGAALTFGHPSTMPTTGVDTLLTVNVSDMTFTPASRARPTGVDAPTNNSSLLYQTFFHQMANDIITYLTSQPQLAASDALRLCTDLDVLQRSLPTYFFQTDPPWFDFSRHKLSWRLDNLRMAVLRSTFLRVSLGQSPITEEEEACWDKCVACAGEVVRSVQVFIDTAPRSCMEWWYTLHFIFPAIFIPLIALRVRPASPVASDWLFVVHSAQSVLERCHHALLKGLAARCLAIISAVANFEQPQPGPLALTHTGGSDALAATGQNQLDEDFTNFLEMLSSTAEVDNGIAAGGGTALHLWPSAWDAPEIASWLTDSRSM